jgi:RHS repeat-associated protein
MNQAVSETVPITGTDLAMVYYSRRAKEALINWSFNIPVTGSTIHPDLVRTDLTVTLAGKTTEVSLAPAPDRSFTFQWDGLDAYGRTAGPYAEVFATVRLCHMYKSYLNSIPFEAQSTFGRAIVGNVPGVEAIGSRDEQLAGLCRTYPRRVVNERASLMGLWELDAFRVFNPLTRETVSGSGARAGGKPALYAEPTTSPFAVAPDGAILQVAPDGSGNRKLFKREGGQWMLVPGQGTANIIVDSALTYMTEDIYPQFYDGWLYVWEATPISSRHALVRYRYSSTSGVTGREIVIPSTGSLSLTDPAVQANEARVEQLAVSAMPFRLCKDCGIVLSDAEHKYRIVPGGVVEVIHSHSNTYANLFAFDVDDRGMLYVNQAVGNSYGIAAIHNDGHTETIASWPSTSTACPVPLPVASCSLSQAAAIAFHAKSKRIYYVLAYSAPGNNYGLALMSVPAYVPGTPTVVVSDLIKSSQSPGSFFSQAYPLIVAGHEAEIYFSGVWASQTFVWKIGQPSAANVGERHVFLPDGRIVETRRQFTDAPLKYFEYDPSGLLSGILDSSNRRTTIVRENGRISQVVSPDGVATSFAYDSSGRLTTITDPDNAGSAVTYHGATQLMRSFTNRNGVTSWYEFDSRGRLVRDWDSEGYLQLTPSGAHTVVKSDADGRVTQYVSHAADGVRTRYVRFPDGTLNAATLRDDGTTTTTRTDGTVITLLSSVDSRLHDAVVPVEKTVKLPSGLTSRTTWLRAIDTNATVTTTRNENTRSWVDTYVPATRTRTFMSPEGRTSAIVFDTLGRPAAVTQPGRATVSLAYYAEHGRLWQVNAGTSLPRSTTLTYDASGWLEEVSALGASTVTFARDTMGRTETQTTAGAITGMNWDAMGNLVQLTTPNADVHDLTYSGRNAVETYVPPLLTGGARPGLQTKTYTAMGEPLSLNLANASSMTFTRDPSSGRVTQVAVGGVTYGYGYHSQTGKLTSLTGSDGRALTMTYDGSLLTGSAWTGSPVVGTVGFAYNADFKPSSFSVNGQVASAFAYDRDQLPTSAGSFTVTRNPQSGNVASTTLGQVTTSSTYDEHGEIATFEARRAGALFYRYAIVQRDGRGRVLELTEASDGLTTAKSYRYDSQERLREVLVNGVSASLYTYTAQGNRLSRETPGSTETGVYDTQDRIDTYDDCQYTTDAAGFLSARDCSDGVETFQYDARGSLRQAALANGDTLQYLIDPIGRRIGRLVNGTLDKGWLYLDDLRPAAQLNSAGQLEAIYVYATRANVPEYIVEKTGGSNVLYRIIADHLGTPRRVVRTSDGVVVHELDVDEWGNITRETGTNTGLHPFGFAGGLRDRGTGLLRFGARDYDPRIGRWTARDPILFGAGQTNLYAYVSNDPINRLDPTGLVVDLPGNFPDLSQVFGALADFASTWWYGVRQDGINDKFYHCLANCQAATRGADGEGMAESLSDGREQIQEVIGTGNAQDSAEDHVANRRGREAGRENAGRPVCEQDGDHCVEACVGSFGFTGDGHSNQRIYGYGGSGG